MDKLHNQASVLRIYPLQRKHKHPTTQMLSVLFRETVEPSPLVSPGYETVAKANGAVYEARFYHQGVLC